MEKLVKTGQKARVTRVSDIELKRQIAERLCAAQERAGGMSDSRLAIAVELHERQVRRYLRAEKMPKLGQLALLADALNVSLDWLITGRDAPPAGLFDWLESSEGQRAPEEARRFCRSVPTHGHRAGLAFYQKAFQAWREGLSPAAASTVAFATVRNAT